MATYYYSLAVLPMSDAVVLTYTSPVLTALAATLFLVETWHSLDFLGSALCLTGWLLLLGFVVSCVEHVQPPGTVISCNQ